MESNLRRRKNFDITEDENKTSASIPYQLRSPSDSSQIKVVKLNNLLWLCIGLAIGCVCGGPWIRKIEDIIYGYRWNYLDRCILETPESGFGVDFCRTPVDCSMCNDVRKIDEVHVSDLPWETFYSRYADTSRPVVIRNASIDWPAMKILDYQWLRDAYMSDPEILEYEDKEECWYNNYKSKHLQSLRNVFRMSDAQVHGQDKTWYVGWSVCQKPVANLLHELYYRPNFLHPDSTPPKKPWIFVGTPGPGAHVHIDNVDQSSWQAQISGVKSWLLRPPPECWWQCHGDMETTVYPGDIIVVNTNVWFHSTKIQGPDLSLVITNEFD